MLAKLALVLAFGSVILYTCETNLDCGANVGADVSPEHGLLDVEGLPLDDNVLDAAHKRNAVGVERLEPSKVTSLVRRVLDVKYESSLPARFRMASDEEAVVGVCGRHAGDADAGLGEHVVHGQSHDVLRV